MSVELLTLLLFGSLFLLMALGVPISFALGGVSVIFIIWQMGLEPLYLVASRVAGQMRTIVLIAVPLFIFMANVLEHSGVARDLFTMIHRWSGPLRGGLAMGTVVICTIFAAMSGISATGTVTMGIIALPAMLQRKYKKTIAIGSIMAGGALGTLIPPSVTMIIYGLYSGVSVAKLFVGGVFPGLLLSTLFLVFIGISCYLRPELGPALPPEERATWGEKFASLKAVILPTLLVCSVLGSIFFGLVTPTEASSVGAFGALVCAAIYRKLNWQMIKEVSYRTLSLTTMIMWIVLAAGLFSAVFSAIGASELMQNLLQTWPVSPWVILVLMQLTWFILGCMVDAISILMITGPVFLPIASFLGFDPLWFGVLYVVNVEMSYLTPPFGGNLFYMRGVAPPEVTMGDIYRSTLPFVMLQGVCLVIVIIFPSIITWLPNLLFPPL